MGGRTYTRWCWKCKKPHRRFTHYPSCGFCLQHTFFPFLHFICHMAEMMKEYNKDTRPSGLDHRTIIADIETHCPVHCPGCNICDLP